jgi:tetratricopeptide (TPR) repeat protein
MGRALWLRGEDEASIRELNEAIGLSPNFALAHYQLGFVQAQTGDAQAAVEAVEVARQLSPFDPMLYAMCAARAWALFRLERFEEAGEWALNTIRQPNASLHARALSALVLARVGRLEESLREVDVVRRLRPGYTINDFFSAFHVLADDKPVYLAAAKQIGMG